MVTALVMLCYKTLELYFIFLFSKKMLVLKAMYMQSHSFHIAIYWETRKKSDTIKKFAPPRIRFFKKVPEKQKINFLWL